MAYRLLTDRFEHTAGTVVYRAIGHDYGMASDDTRLTGEEHISVTLDPDGGYPFFTAPIDALQDLGPNPDVQW